MLVMRMRRGQFGNMRMRLWIVPIQFFFAMPNFVTVASNHNVAFCKVNNFADSKPVGIGKHNLTRNRRLLRTAPHNNQGGTHD